MKDRSREIRIFSILIIIYTLWDYRIFVDFNYYAFLFHDLPHNVLLSRYIFSLCFRVLLLVTSVGVFFFKELFRKLIVYIGIFTVGTIYWKHPLQSFEAVVTRLVESGGVPANVMPLVDAMPRILLVVSYLFDIGFALCMIVFFSLAEVKAQFRK